MKKNIYITILSLIFTLTSPIYTHAMEAELSFIRIGSTENGIEYQIYGNTISSTDDSITVQRTIIYNGQVTPSTTLSWKETIEGIVYSGTLRLFDFEYNKSCNQTTAYYYGTLMQN